MKADPRKTALKILNTLDKKRDTLDSIIESSFANNHALTQQDKSLANAIVFGVIRWRGQIDWIISNFSKTRIKKINPKILNILRMGIFQIKFLSKIPCSAAVNTSVELAKKNAPSWVTGYVNATLRKIAKNIDSIPFPDIDHDPAFYISVRYSFPLWMVKRWITRFGIKETILLCEKINIIPPITIRTNINLVSRDRLFELIKEFAKQAKITDLSSAGISFHSPKTPLYLFPPLKKGWLRVQDEAAQLVSFFLDPKPGETVLDACAGLGGKTGHIAELMKNRGELFAQDINKKKLLVLEKEIKLLKTTNIKILFHDLNKPLNKLTNKKYDKILLDAPCSGIGVLRRNPDLKWSITKETLLKNQQKQITFLLNLSESLKINGIMVYVVCSIDTKETVDVINKFLYVSDNFRITPAPNSSVFSKKNIINKQGFLETFPHIHDMDGFFAARLIKIR